MVLVVADEILDVQFELSRILSSRIKLYRASANPIFRISTRKAYHFEGA